MPSKAFLEGMRAITTEGETLRALIDAIVDLSIHQARSEDRALLQIKELKKLREDALHQQKAFQKSEFLISNLLGKDTHDGSESQSVHLRSLLDNNKTNAVLVQLMRQFDLVDTDYYHQQSIIPVSMELYEIHYLQFGWKIGRRISPFFDEIWYFNSYPDAQIAGFAPLEHYLLYGIHENRMPNKYFDPIYYLAQNDDVASSDIHPLIHYRQFGWREGRNPSAAFDVKSYQSINKDIVEKGIEPLYHFLRYGEVEGRSFSKVHASTAITPDRILLGNSAIKSDVLVSIVVPLYNTKVFWFSECVRSLRAQSHSNLQIILVDDASTDPLVKVLIARAMVEDDRIDVVLLDENQGISLATNEGLKICKGQYVIFVDHDDFLYKDAVLSIVQSFSENDEIAAIYSDHNMETEFGEVVSSVKKPDWSPVFFLGSMYVAHVLAVRKEFAHAVGGFDSSYDGVQDYEFLLRLSRTGAHIRHLSEVQYGWRMVPGSIAAGTENKPQSATRQVAAVNSHLQALGMQAFAEPHPRVNHRVVLRPTPSFSINKILIIFDDRRVKSEVLDFLDDGSKDTGPTVAVVRFSRFAEFSGDQGETALIKLVNQRIIMEKSLEYIVLLDSRTIIEDENWLKTLAVHLQLPGASVASAMIVNNGEVLTAGREIVAGLSISNRFQGAHVGDDGPLGMLSCACEVTLPSSGIIIFRADHFRSEGGLSDWLNWDASFDDYCLRLRRKGRSCISVPSVRATLAASPPVSDDATQRLYREILLDKWQPQFSDF